MTAPNPWTLTLREAADHTGASLRTLRRRLADGAFPNAAKDDGPSGAWRVPVTDLEAAGLPVTVPRPTADPVPPLDDTRLAAAEERARAAEDRASKAEERARLAEAIAEERGKALDDTRLALRALTAGPAPVANEKPQAADGQTPSARTRFSQRIFRKKRG